MCLHCLGYCCVPVKKQAVKRRCCRGGQWLIREAVRCSINKLVKSSGDAEGLKIGLGHCVCGC